ncbi:zinc metallopeptidase [Parasporobacterium paucivorans]|uniref:Neutral zinc metallopeptidase n=1 Tax=Parasporobacterium paucivorans DSM 15970 TaxID=1122934 RepID=A0A1M6ES47_9FIRM|nr:zinc metallopeptidase [Parasporobacterium paucivorans]SHI88301.1 hypothetical protein SAMN02745691_00988 [Parasporobacterium paucivorans DSM 15970]
MIYGYYDSTYWMVIIGIVISLVASSRVKSSFNKYSHVRSLSGITGAQAAQKILQAEGLYDVRINHISGNLNDHYDPRTKELNLSDATYASASVAAIGVAAHECGHAIQDANAYVPLKIRGALVPVANFGSGVSWFLIIIGLFINSSASQLLINTGIICFSAAVLFHLITLPVEFNASARAVHILDERGLLTEEELKMTKKVLSAAALTYVASAAAMVLQLLRLLLLFGGRRRD